jgi:hypothetical protein
MKKRVRSPYQGKSIELPQQLLMVDFVEAFGYVCIQNKFRFLSNCRENSFDCIMG